MTDHTDHTKRDELVERLKEVSIACSSIYHQNTIRMAISALTAQQTVRVPVDLLDCALISLRGALDCKSWSWDADQWAAADEWHDALKAMLRPRKRVQP